MTGRALPGAWLLLVFAVWAGLWLPGFHREWIAAFWTPPGWSWTLFGTALAGHLRAALAAVVVLAAAVGAAGPALRWLKGRAGSPTIRLAAGVALIAPLLGLGIGWTGLLRPAIGLPLLVIGALSAIRTVRRPDRMSESSPHRFCILLFGFLLLPSLLLALSPETHYDALQYHLALPERFRLHGRVFDPAFPPYSRFHLGGEMFLAFGGLAGGDAAARLAIWALLPVVVALTVGTARAAGAGTPGAVAAGIAVAASPVLAVTAGHALTDLPALIAVAAVARLAMTGRGTATAVAIGTLLGGAGAVKLTLVPLGLVALPLLIPRRAWLPALAGWTLPLLPWIARTWLESGSPAGGLFFPALLPPFDFEPGVRTFREHTEWSAAGWRRWLGLPGLILGEGVRGGHELSPLFVAALPVLLLPARHLTPRAAPLARAALAMTAGWAVGGGGQIRWLLPALVLLLPAAAAVAAPRGPVIVAAALGAALGWARTCVFLFATANPTGVALGVVPARAWLNARLTPPGAYLSLAGALADDPALGRAYVAGDLKAYYWPREPAVDAQHVTPRLVRWARETGDARRLRVKLRQLRVGCLVHRNEGSLTLQELAGGYRWTGAGLNAVERLIASSDRVLAIERPEANAFYYVYALRPPTRPTPVADLRWLALPCAELLFLPGDKLLAAGKPREAEPVYRDLAVRYPESALPWLRLAECARLRKDPAAVRRCDAQAARRLGVR